MACAACVIRVSGCAIDRPAKNASAMPTTSASSAEPKTASLARSTIRLPWPTSLATRTTPGPPRTAT